MMAKNETPPDDDLTDTGNGTLVGNVNPDEYYRLEAQTSDWQWLLSSAIVKRGLSEPTGENKTPPAFVRMMPGDVFPIFYIRKTVVKPAELAKVLGYKGDPERLATTDVIHLKPIGDQSGWETPTVPYAGAA